MSPSPFKDIIHETVYEKALVKISIHLSTAEPTYSIILYLQIIYLITWFCNSIITTREAFKVIHRNVQNCENIWIAWQYLFPAKVKQSHGLHSSFSSHTINKYPFAINLVSFFFHFLHLLLVILLFKMASKCCSSTIQCS